MLLLILAHRHPVGFLDEDVDSHKGGIGEEAGVDALAAALIAYDLLFDILVGVVFLACGGDMDSELLSGLVLKGGGAHELAYAYVHVEQKVELAHLGYVALHKNGGLFGVEAGGKVFGHNVLDIGMELCRVGIGGEGVEIGYEKVGVIVVLHPDKLRQRAEVVAQVEITGGAYAAQYYLFFIV